MPAKDQEMSEAQKALATNREDFMKRWFAIAISVGFATALSSMPWLRDGVGLDPKLPIDWEQVKQATRLVAAAVATILSWDGYFQSISKKRLIDGGRFAIDVFLVFLYLFLLLTSKFNDFWLAIHAFAFVFYCLWDYLSIRTHRMAYVEADVAPPDFIPTIWEVYRGSFCDDPKIYRGPAITALWPIYFASLPITYFLLLENAVRELPLTTFIYAALVIYGLFAYRHDKKIMLGWKSRMVFIAFSVAVVLGSDFLLNRVA